MLIWKKKKNSKSGHQALIYGKFKLKKGVKHFGLVRKLSELSPSYFRDLHIKFHIAIQCDEKQNEQNKNIFRE